MLYWFIYFLGIMLSLFLLTAHDYIIKLQRERDKVLEEQEMLRKESQQLFASIRWHK